ETAWEKLGADLSRLTARYDRRRVRGGKSAAPSAAVIAAFEDVVNGTNDLLEQVRVLSAYVNALITTDGRDDRAASVYSALQARLADLQRLTTRFEAWVGRFGADALASASRVAAEHRHALR